MTATRTETSPIPAPSVPTPELAPRRIAPTLARLLAAAVALFAVLLALPGTASAATYAPGNYSGNWCGSSWRYLDNAGSEACVNRGAVAPWSSIDLQAGAYDYGRDGYSAKSTVQVFQYSGGRWTHTHTLPTAIASNGYGTSNLAAAVRVARAGTSSHILVRITSCTYNRPTNQNINCAVKDSPAMSWSGS